MTGFCMKCYTGLKLVKISPKTESFKRFTGNSCKFMKLFLRTPSLLALLTLYMPPSVGVTTTGILLCENILNEKFHQSFFIQYMLSKTSKSDKF